MGIFSRKNQHQKKVRKMNEDIKLFSAGVNAPLDFRHVDLELNNESLSEEAIADYGCLDSFNRRL